MADTDFRKPNRWIPIALVVSLAVNLFVAGAFLGRPFFGDGPPPRPDGGPGSILASPHVFRQVLGEEDGKRAFEVFREHRGTVHENFGQLRVAREKLNEAILAEPYDPAAVRDGFAAVREAHEAIATAIQQPMMEMLGTLDAEQRAKVVAALKERRRPAKDDRHSGPPGGERGEGPPPGNPQGEGPGDL